MPGLPSAPLDPQVAQLLELIARAKRPPINALDPEDAKIADVVLIAWRTVPMHVGILTPWRHEGETAPFGLLHAMIEVRGVAEHRFDPLRHNVVGYYRLPELL